MSILFLSNGITSCFRPSHGDTSHERNKLSVCKVIENHLTFKQGVLPPLPNVISKYLLAYYRCNVCKMETRTAQEVTSHMFVEHGVRARLERAAAIHQCPQCPFEDNQKGKLTRHKVGCDKRFRGERNQEPPHDWEPPAKIPKPAILPHQVKI